MRRVWMVGFAVICLWGAGMAPMMPSLQMVGVAWADDGEGDGGDGDGDDGGSSSPSGGRGASGGGGGGSVGTGEVDSPRDVIRAFQQLFRGQSVDQPPARSRQRAAPQPAPRPERAPDEIVARDLTPEDTATLVAQGYAVLESVDLASLATTIRRFGLPDGVTLEAARATVRALPSGEAADFNHYYRTGQDGMATAAALTDAPEATCDGLHCPARALINWPEGTGPAGCGAPLRIGIVDTGLNPDHEALVAADIEVTRIAPEDYSPSDAIHGTAVAALLVGNPNTRVPGLLPGARLSAVDAFYRDAGDERADAFTLVRALDRLAQDGVQVINLSLAGPPNTVLEATLDQLADQRGIVVVAATGNAGPRADPAYPAAYDGVIAVTAVDRGGTAYRRAGRGPHVDLAAQGVEVWTAASIEGARWRTGTSFAAPFVTGAAALWLQHDPMLSPAAVRGRLVGTATDLGPEGRDDIYGYGLLDLGGRCPGSLPLLPVSAE
ncbi:S8 family serine peptidase [Roseovarius tibetensis]|uniref:S8 family serine peptidase n=1 Tax=Roseovarius tibetensis TaxID=2685897 RepID=UPI003D7F7447